MKIKDKDFYTKHLHRQKDIELGKRIVDYINSVINSHSIEVTDFLDPHQRYIAKSILNRFDIGYHFEGIGKNCERKIIVMYQNYIDTSQLDLETQLMKINGKSKFFEITHRDVLGSLLGLGLDRSKIGDILILDDEIQIIVSKKISFYIETHLEKIGKVGVKAVNIDSKCILEVVPKAEEIAINVSSLRLDSIVAATYNLNRQSAANLIKNEKVKLNWTIETKVFLEVDIEDQISVRGHGRFRIKSLDGQTKKGRYRVTVMKLI